MADLIFPDGLIIKEIETKNWTMKKVSVKVEEFKTFLDTYDENGWVNLNLNRGRSWKYYFSLDTFKPNKNYKSSNASDNITWWISVEDIPF